MNWPTLAVADYLALLTLVGGALAFIFKLVDRMRKNDLRHLDEKIDLHHNNVMAGVQRIEDKIDEHVRDHAAGLFR